MQPRQVVQAIEQNASLPSGNGDRLIGYSVIGLPFRSEHVLALRKFPASSVGPGYTSVWHRNPSGEWTFYSTVPPDQGCAKYFGREVHRNVVTPIEIRWSSPVQFSVTAGNALRWDVSLKESLLSRLLNTVASQIPEAWWQKRSMLRVMGITSQFLLGTGKMNLVGRTPNGQEFTAIPQRMWLIDSSQAMVKGQDIGPVGALTHQAALRDFLIPQRGIFAVGRTFMGVPRNGTAEGHAWDSPTVNLD
ncbi:MAG: hypothetical protein LAO31_10545 [Acidobacteriia bacterium]|nr:hypothetical protein [Terriglobia bacterium]